MLWQTKIKKNDGLQEISAMSKVDKGLTNANYQPEKTHTEILVSKNCHKVRKGIFKKWLLKKLISLCEDT